MPLILATGRIVPTDLGTDTDLARRILIRAREIQPAIVTFDTGTEERADALAILKGVYARASAIGAGAVSSQSRNGTSISLRDIRSAFYPDDISGLRSLTDAGPDSPTGLPRGSFPTDRPISRLWPEDCS
ncbi:MAG: MPMin1 gp44 [Microbacterium sp.]|jgi:hypothetical protein|nr:MPMin1 gp44 [Microbacterium sp.]